MINLSKFLELAGKATPGPWRRHALRKFKTLRTGIGVSATDCLIYREVFDPVCLPETHRRQETDALFIATTRTLAPALAEAIREIAELEFESVDMVRGHLASESIGYNDCLQQVKDILADHGIAP